jgi:hypothetical protein
MVEGRATASSVSSEGTSRNHGASQASFGSRHSDTELSAGTRDQSWAANDERDTLLARRNRDATKEGGFPMS